MKNQTFGIEIETTGIGRERTAKASATTWGVYELQLYRIRRRACVLSAVPRCATPKRAGTAGFVRMPVGWLGGTSTRSSWPTRKNTVTHACVADVHFRRMVSDATDESVQTIVNGPSDLAL